MSSLLAKLIPVCPNLVDACQASYLHDLVINCGAGRDLAYTRRVFWNHLKNLKAAGVCAADLHYIDAVYQVTGLEGISCEG